MKNLVLQVQIPNDRRPYPKRLWYDKALYEASKASCQAYADRVGASYMCIGGDSWFPGLHASYQKLAFLDMPVYDNVLYVDSDAVIQPGCPNAFEIENCGLAAVPDFDPALLDHERRRQRTKVRLGIKGEPFCAGVLLVTREWCEKMRGPVLQNLHLLAPEFSEQGILNMVTDGKSYTQLSPDWGAWYRDGKFINHYGADRKLARNPTTPP